MKKGEFFSHHKDCPHGTYQVVSREGNLVYARCYGCFILFKFTKKEWDKEFRPKQSKKETKK